jgi:hypothetical protein
MNRKLTHKYRIKQLTLRGFDSELEQKLGELARAQDISLNRAALMMLRKGAGLNEKQARSDVIGDTLDHLIGKWSERQEKEFLRAVESLEQVDEDMWK